MQTKFRPIVAILYVALLIPIFGQAQTNARTEKFFDPPTPIKDSAEITRFFSKINASCRLTKLRLHGLEIIGATTDLGSGRYIPQALIYIKKDSRWQLARQQSKEPGIIEYQFQINGDSLQIIGLRMQRVPGTKGVQPVIANLSKQQLIDAVKQ